MCIGIIKPAYFVAQKFIEKFLDEVEFSLEHAKLAILYSTLSTKTPLVGIFIFCTIDDTGITKSKLTPVQLETFNGTYKKT